MIQCIICRMAEKGASCGEGDEVKSLEVGQLIRPVMTSDTAIKLVEKLYAMKVSPVNQLKLSITLTIYWTYLPFYWEYDIFT